MKTLTILWLFFYAFTTAQTVFTYSGSGNWTNTANWSPSFPGTTIDANEEVIISASSNVESTTFITINGTLTIEGSYTSRSFLTINGTLVNNNNFRSQSFFTNNSTFNNLSSFTSQSAFTNAGTMNNTGSFVSQSNFINNGSLINDTGSIQLISALYGSNSSHTGDYQLSIQLRPGTSTAQGIGTYQFNNNLSIESSSTLITEIESATGVDLVTSAGTVTISGRLTVNLLNNYDPLVGEIFTILSAANIVGTFSSVTLPDLGPTKEFSVNYQSNTVTIEVIDSITLGVPEITSQQNVSIYPSPAKQFITVSGTKNNLKTFKIYTTTGIMVKEITPNSSQNTIIINISDLPSGYYLLNAASDAYPFIKQ